MDIEIGDIKDIARRWRRSKNPQCYHFNSSDMFSMHEDEYTTCREDSCDKLNDAVDDIETLLEYIKYQQELLTYKPGGRVMIEAKDNYYKLANSNNLQWNK